MATKVYGVDLRQCSTLTVEKRDGRWHVMADGQPIDNGLVHKYCAVHNAHWLAGRWENLRFVQ